MTQNTEGTEGLMYVRPASEVVAMIGHDADSFFRRTEMMFVQPLEEGLNAVVMLVEFSAKGHADIPFKPTYSQFGKVVVANVGKQPTSMMTTIGHVSRDIGHAFLGAISPNHVPTPRSGHARYKMASTPTLWIPGDNDVRKAVAKNVFALVKRGDYVTVVEGGQYGAIDMYLCITEARTIMYILTRDGFVLRDDGLDHELESEEGKLRFLPVDLPPGIRANALITLPGPYGANALIATNGGVRNLQGRVYCHTNGMNVRAMVAHPTENIIYFVGDDRLFAINHTDEGQISTANPADLGPCEIDAFDEWKIFAGPQIRHQEGPGVLLCGWKGVNYSSRILNGTSPEAMQ